MTLPTRLLGVVAVAAAAAPLVLPGAASAKAGDRTYQQTFPLASRMCANLAAGKARRLRPFAVQVTADCAKLQSSFEAARSAVLAAHTATATAVAADRATVTASCAGPLKGGVGCKHARRTEGRAIAALMRKQMRDAHRYYRTIESDRVAFWKAIHALPGLADIHADAPIALQPS
jgi:hypothetical protein